MSNPLKYVTSTPTGALRHANLGAGVASIQYDETFNSGLNPSTLTTYYLVYEPVNGASTRIYAPANSTELITLAQSKGSGETTEAGSLAWLSDNGYYPANKVLNNVVTDDLEFYIDSRDAISYPRSKSDILDLSGEGNDGTLINGPSFDEDSEALVFDGIDDYISTNFTSQLGDLSVVVVFKNDSSVAWGRLVDKSYSTGFFISSYFATFGSGYVGAGIIEPSSPHGQALQYNTSKHNYFVVTRSGTTHTIYLNGSGTSSSKVGSSANISSTAMAIGSWFDGRSSQIYTGEISQVSLYSKALTTAEIDQNYYQGSITTTNLVGAFDPSNLVSYEPGTTTTFSLTGSAGAAGDGTLDNGVAYSDSGNGAWVLDGVDDQIDFGNPSSLSNAQVTVTFWYNPTTLMNNTHGGIINGRTPGGRFCLFWINGTTLSTQYRDDSGLSAAQGGVWTRSNAPVAVSANKWYFIQITGNESTNEWRVGVDLNVSTTSFSSQYVDPDSNQWLLGRRASAAYDHSKIANLQIYDRILSQVEIEQNYNANVKKFT